MCTTEELLAAIDLLVEFGADVDARHRGVGTPLDYALNVAPEAVIDFLRQHGARTSE